MGETERDQLTWKFSTLWMCHFKLHGKICPADLHGSISARHDYHGDWPANWLGLTRWIWQCRNWNTSHMSHESLPFRLGLYLDYHGNLVRLSLVLWDYNGDIDIESTQKRCSFFLTLPRNHGGWGDNPTHIWSYLVPHNGGATWCNYLTHLRGMGWITSNQSNLHHKSLD